MIGTLLLILRLLLALALYSFLAWALFSIWQDLRKQSYLIQNQPLPNLALQPAPGSGQGLYLFTGSEVFVGRDPHCDCYLDDVSISAQHARLYYRKGQWWVEDLGSTNGTLLNNQLVSMPTVLTSGDELRFGKVSLTVLLNLIHDRSEKAD